MRKQHHFLSVCISGLEAIRSICLNINSGLLTFSEYTFTLSDKLYGLQVKVHKMASDRLTSASKFGFNPPNPFVGVHVLKDEVAKGMTSIQRGSDRTNNIGGAATQVGLKAVKSRVYSVA